MPSEYLKNDVSNETFLFLLKNVFIRYQLFNNQTHLIEYRMLKEGSTVNKKILFIST